MAKTAGAASEEVINYYYDQVCSEADTIYRFAYAITLDLAEASRCVYQAYKDVSSDLERFHREDTNVVPLLMAACWRAFGGAAGKTKGTGTSAVATMMGDLTIEERGAVACADIVGIRVKEAAKVMGKDEAKVRELLANGRRHLMQTEPV